MKIILLTLALLLLSSISFEQTPNSSMQLIAAPPFDRGQVLRAGIEIKLEGHYKTYWRTPGASGVAPRISFEGSENLKTANVVFPSPTLFKDSTIGYQNHVIWPIRVVPMDVNKPVMLRVKVDYGICDKICIPVSDTAELSVSANESAAFDEKLRSFENRVPVQTELGQGKNLSINHISEPNNNSFLVNVKSDNAPYLLAEAKLEGWFLEVSDAISKPNSVTQYKITAFNSEAKNNIIPCDIRLTAITQSEAIEMPIRVKACVEKP